MVVLRCLDEFGDSSDSVFRGVCECRLVFETLLSDSTELEGVSSQFGHWTISMSSDNRLRSMGSDWWITMNSSDEGRWCFLYFVFTKSTEFPKTQCFQWFSMFCFRFENPLRNPYVESINRSDWTVYSCSLTLMNLSKSAFNSRLTLNFSELLLYSSEVWITIFD